MKPIDGYFLIKPEDLAWRPSNLMKIPNADFLERTGSEILGARLWRLPPKSANTLHKHPKAEEFYFVVEGTGRMRVGDETITVPKHGGVMVGPKLLRQVFNDTNEEVLWLIRRRSGKRIRRRRAARHEGLLSGRSERVAERIGRRAVATKIVGGTRSVASGE
jgi:mannose-6-phosphate isomerase-like protein (cupin superfamily)